MPASRDFASGESGSSSPSWFPKDSLLLDMKEEAFFNKLDILELHLISGKGREPVLSFYKTKLFRPLYIHWQDPLLKPLV